MTKRYYRFSEIERREAIGNVVATVGSAFAGDIAIGYNEFGVVVGLGQITWAAAGKANIEWLWTTTQECWSYIVKDVVLYDMTT